MTFWILLNSFFIVEMRASELSIQKSCQQFEDRACTSYRLPVSIGEAIISSTSS
jgi:hypothetical protein